MAKKTPRDMTCAPFIRDLRRNGWTLRYDTVAGGERTVEFFYFFGRREVQVQLWGSGTHRATNMIYSDRALMRGRMSTRPTEFTTPEGMWRAIAHERKRTDHPPIDARHNTSTKP